MRLLASLLVIAAAYKAVAQNSAGDFAPGVDGCIRDPYYYYGYCTVPDTGKKVFECPEKGTLKIQPSLADFGGPSGEDPSSGYIVLDEAEYADRCDITIAPRKATKGINVRVRYLCADPLTPYDQWVMVGTGGAEGKVQGDQAEGNGLTSAGFTAMGAKATIKYKAGKRSSITCPAGKRGKLCRKCVANNFKGKACKNLDENGLPKPKSGGPRRLQDASTGEGNSTAIYYPPLTKENVTFVIEYDTTPGCTPVAYPEKARRCYNSNNATNPLVVTGHANATGKLVAEGPWASDCFWTFDGVPAGYRVELTVSCLAAGMGNVTVFQSDGDKAGSIKDYKSFLECDEDANGCTYKNLGDSPTVRFQMAPWADVLNGLRSDYWYYYSYWLTNVEIAYKIVPIPGTIPPPPEPAYTCPAPPEGATVYTFAKTDDMYYYDRKYENYYNDDVDATGNTGTWYNTYNSSYGSYLSAYGLKPGDTGYIYLPAYEANASFSASLSASGETEGTIDIEVICADTEADYDYLSIYGMGGDSITGRLAASKTISDLGSSVYVSFWSDASINGGGFLIKYTVRQSDRCPYGMQDYSYSSASKSFYCYQSYAGNVSDVPVKLKEGAKGQFVVNSYSANVCNFNLTYVPRGYEVRVGVQCLANGAGELDVYDESGALVQSFDDAVAYKMCPECTASGLKQGASLSFQSNYGQMVNYTYTYWQPYYYYPEYDYNNDPLKNVTDYRRRAAVRRAMAEVKAAERRRHARKLLQDRPDSNGNYYSNNTYVNGTDGYWVTYSYSYPSNQYPYWTPQLLISYEVVPIDGELPPEEERENKCTYVPPAGAAVIDLSPSNETYYISGGVKTVIEDRYTNSDGKYEGYYNRRRLLQKRDDDGISCDAAGQCNGDYTGKNETYPETYSYSPYVYGSPSYVSASIPIPITAPFDPKSAPEGYIVMGKYSSSYYASIYLYTVSTNPYQALPNDTTIEVTVVCLDTEENADYLSMYGWVPSSSNYTDYNQYGRYVYSTLSGQRSFETYEMGQSVSVSFYADDSVEYSGFALKWRVVKSNGSVDGSDTATGGVDPNKPGRTFRSGKSALPKGLRAALPKRLNKKNFA